MEVVASVPLRAVVALLRLKGVNAEVPPVEFKLPPRAATQTEEAASMPLQPHRPPLHIEAFEDATVVRVAVEDLGEANLQAFAEDLSTVIDGVAHRPLYLDLGSVRYLTSTALGKLIALHKRMRKHGGRLTLVNLTPLVYEVFEVTQLHRLLDIRRGPGDAPGRSTSPLAS
jgi:anti-sigma B factor antagonist